jgi:hypothetical protein
MADVKAPKKDSISAPENLAKARNETYDVSKIAPKPFKSEPKFERNPFKGDHDSLKGNLKRPKLTTGLRQSKISPGETELYIKNSYEPSDAPENLAKARNEEVEHLDETPGAQAMKASGVKQSPDKLLARTGMNLAHKFPRKGQTNLGNIPAMNTPGNSPETDAYAEKRRGDRAKELKPAIKSALGTHGPKGKLPEEVELHESLMSHIEVKPARKHKDPEILAVHDVHYKGKKIGDIEVYHHRSGMKYGSTHDATGNSTAGHRTMDQAIDDIRQEHAQHLKSMKEEVDITTDTLAGRSDGGKDNSFKKFKVKLKGDGIERPMADKPESTPSISSIKAEEVQVEATIAGISGFKPMKQDVKDKSGAVHTPMSRAKDLARQAFKTVQNKTKVK